MFFVWFIDYNITPKRNIKRCHAQELFVIRATYKYQLKYQPFHDMFRVETITSNVFKWNPNTNGFDLLHFYIHYSIFCYTEFYPFNKF